MSCPVYSHIIASAKIDGWQNFDTSAPIPRTKIFIAILSGEEERSSYILSVKCLQSKKNNTEKHTGSEM